MSGSRLEKDSFGTIEVPADRLWGAQTERSRRFFRISGERMPLPVIYALALVKKAAAAVNAELNLLAKDKAEAIQRAADEVLDGRHDGEFPLVVLVRAQTEDERAQGEIDQAGGDPRY